jgi:hypothetical protein
MRQLHITTCRLPHRAWRADLRTAAACKHRDHYDSAQRVTQINHLGPLFTPCHFDNVERSPPHQPADLSSGWLD